MGSHKIPIPMEYGTYTADSGRVWQSDHRLSMFLVPVCSASYEPALIDVVSDATYLVDVVALKDITEDSTMSVAEFIGGRRIPRHSVRT